MANRRLCQDDDATTGGRHWIPSLFRNRAQSSDDLRTTGTTSATCVETSVEEFTGVASSVAINEVATASRCTGKRKITEVLGQESTEDTRDGFGKQLRFLDTAINQRQGGYSVAVEGRTVGRHGHSFSQVYSTDNASVHMGDRFGDGTTINHNYFGLCAAMNLRLSQDIEPTEEAILRLAVVIIVAAVANVIVQPFLLLRNALHRALPYAVQRRATPLSSLFGSRTVLFEDALGRFERIDINIVTDWTSFHYNLTRAFADQPGHRRVAVAGYRLFDQAQDTQLIDPRCPPPFASVFMRNKHVRMSIHFAWDEVSLECCPKCGLKQVCELDKETICKAKACGFSYRGHIKDSPIVELEDDDDDDEGPEERPGRKTNMEQRADPRKRLLKNEQENPAWFSRISVSRQPEESAICKNSEAIVDITMLAIRSTPAAKPVKTERSHEENQERAYIAASRRSDRSLEARIESARRASEVHKRRTGRSLRITEQDVINEEIYEEEDDLSMQYRSLTTHLQTQNADFNRRLAAYLTNHVAMSTQQAARQPGFRAAEPLPPPTATSGWRPAESFPSSGAPPPQAHSHPSRSHPAEVEAPASGWAAVNYGQAPKRSLDEHHPHHDSSQPGSPKKQKLAPTPLGQAVSDAWQNNQFNNIGQFMNLDLLHRHGLSGSDVGRASKICLEANIDE